MLDIQFIREHADVVKESQRKRGESVELVDEVLRSDEVRRSSLKEFEAARAQQKEIGKKVAAAPADEKAKLIAATKELSQKVSEYKAAADAAAEEYTTAMWKLSNIVEPEAPEGGEDDYVVVKKVGQIRDFAAEGFEPKDHLTLGRGVAGIDMERGVKVGGSRFYFLRGQVARMQIAMLTMAVDQAEEHGFTLAITPTLVRPEVMRGTGFLNSHADEIYRLREPDDQYLVGTSEVALAGMHENEILNLERRYLLNMEASSNMMKEALNRFPYGNLNRATRKSSGNNGSCTSTFHLEDGSYLRLQNLSLGYTLPDKWFRGTTISKMRVYIQGTNLFTLDVNPHL